PGARRVGLGEVEFDHLALAHLADAREAQPRERVADRLALRVEDARLQHHMHSCLHAVLCCPLFACRPLRAIAYWTVSGPCRSAGPLSGRMPSRRATS